MVATTGMLIAGKISVAVRKAASVPMSRIRIASTRKVYGRWSAILTIHMRCGLFDGRKIAPCRCTDNPRREHDSCPRRQLRLERGQHTLEVPAVEEIHHELGAP